MKTRIFLQMKKQSYTLTVFTREQKCVILILIKNAQFELSFEWWYIGPCVRENHIAMRNLKCAIQMIIWVTVFWTVCTSYHIAICNLKCAIQMKLCILKFKLHTLLSCENSLSFKPHYEQMAYIYLNWIFKSIFLIFLQAAMRIQSYTIKSSPVTRTQKPLNNWSTAIKWLTTCTNARPLQQNHYFKPFCYYTKNNWNRKSYS